MSSDITMSLDISELSKVIRETHKLTGRPVRSLVAASALWFIQSARKLTPKARKGSKREIIVDPSPEMGERDGRGNPLRKGTRFAIIAHRQGLRPRFIYTDNPRDIRRLVPNVGTAKNSWIGMLRHFGRRDALTGDKRGASLGSASNTGTRDDPEFTLVNTLSYLNDVAPGIGQQAIQRTANRMEKNLDRQVGNALKRMW
jgi:hypothetical protein